MPDPQTSDMSQMSALPLASDRLTKLCLNELLDRDLSKNFLYFHNITFSLFF